MINDEPRSPRAWKLRGEYRKLSNCEAKNYIIVLNYPVKNIKFNYSKRQIENEIRLNYADATEKQISAHAGQIFTSLNYVNEKDIVIIPTNKGKFFTIGVVEQVPKISMKGDVIFQFAMKRKDIPLSLFDQDLRYSFMAIMKICEVKRNNAAQRLMSISNGSDDPSF